MNLIIVIMVKVFNHGRVQIKACENHAVELCPTLIYFLIGAMELLFPIQYCMFLLQSVVIGNLFIEIITATE